MTICSLLNLDICEIENKLSIFYKTLGIELNFKKLNISKVSFQEAVLLLNQDRIKNNPKTVTSFEIDQIYNYNIELCKII